MLKILPSARVRCALCKTTAEFKNTEAGINSAFVRDYFQGWIKTTLVHRWWVFLGVWSWLMEEHVTRLNMAHSCIIYFGPLDLFTQNLFILRIKFCAIKKCFSELFPCSTHSLPVLVCVWSTSTWPLWDSQVAPVAWDWCGRACTRGFKLWARTNAAPPARVLQLLFHSRLKPPVVNLLSLMSGPLQSLESPVA